MAGTIACSSENPKFNTFGFWSVQIVFCDNLFFVNLIDDIRISCDSSLFGFLNSKTADVWVSELHQCSEQGILFLHLNRSFHKLDFEKIEFLRQYSLRKNYTFRRKARNNPSQDHNLPLRKCRIHLRRHDFELFQSWNVLKIQRQCRIQIPTMWTAEFDKLSCPSFPLTNAEGLVCVL